MYARDSETMRQSFVIAALIQSKVSDASVTTTVALGSKVIDSKT